MGLIDRARAAVKAFTQPRPRWWSIVVGRRIDWASAVNIDRLGNSAVAAAVGWIARNFPEAPLRVVSEENGEDVVVDDPGVRRMLDLIRKPNPHWSGAVLWMATVTDYWVHGNAIWMKVRGAAGGAVTELWWVPWTLIEPKWDNDQEYISYYSYRPGGTEIKVAPEDVVHFRWGIDPQNVRIGRSPLAAAIREVYTDDEAGEFSAVVLRNLGVPGVIISPEGDAEIGEEEADRIKATFTERFSGEGRGGPLVTSGKVNVSVLSWSPEQLNLRDLRRIPEERITALLGVPAIVAGLGAGLDRSTFANFAEAREAAWEECLIPTMRVIAQQIEAQLLPEFSSREGLRVEFDLSKVRVLQEDQNRIWQRAGDAAAKGLISLATFRSQVGLPVEDIHRVYLRPFNLVEVPEEQAPAEQPLPQET
jgi:HK97 family phage portal protein